MDISTRKLPIKRQYLTPSMKSLFPIKTPTRRDRQRVRSQISNKLRLFRASVDEKMVIDVSTHPITNPQRRLLAKGSKFIITPKGVKNDKEQEQWLSFKRRLHNQYCFLRTPHPLTRTISKHPPYGKPHLPKTLP